MDKISSETKIKPEKVHDSINNADLYIKYLVATENQIKDQVIENQSIMKKFHLGLDWNNNKLFTQYSIKPRK